MIIINAAMLQDKLIESVTSIPEPKITFVEKKGMELHFTSEDEQTATAVAKKTLKAMPEFKTVYFQINVR